MSGQAGGLEGVFVKHSMQVEMNNMVPPYLWCVCGWRSDDATSAHWASGEHARLAHAHQADAVRAWLLAQREVVAFRLWRQEGWTDAEAAEGWSLTPGSICDAYARQADAVLTTLTKADQ